MIHQFTNTIIEILRTSFGTEAEQVYERSTLLQYLNVKTRSANKGAKARGSFANIYALYILVEDYIDKGYDGSTNNSYSDYEGAKFTDLLMRQRQLPFGSKLQNHALNSRLNGEFARYFPTASNTPILRDQQTQRYWINEQMLKVVINSETIVNIALSIIKIIQQYIKVKRTAFENFIQSCQLLEQISIEDQEKTIDFVMNQLQPNVDARIFEIISFAILKTHYSDQTIYWGWSREGVKEDALALYKTGRTNANDGGIDFVMRPLGRFFQVTEVIDVKKYFLDIDKVQHFPVTFVVKSDRTIEEIREQLQTQAERAYGITKIVSRYMESVNEIINLGELSRRFSIIVQLNKIKQVMNEIIIQSKIEFNYEEDHDDLEEDIRGY